MTPINYTTKNGIITFHYRYQDLKWFLTNGRATGDVGMILIRYNKQLNLKTYRGFGIFSHSKTKLIYIHMKNLPTFDGEFDPERVINPKPIVFESMGFMIPLGHRTNTTDKTYKQILDGHSVWLKKHLQEIHDIDLK